MISNSSIPNLQLFKLPLSREILKTVFRAGSVHFPDNNFVRPVSPFFYYRPQITAATVVLIYGPYSSAINRDLYGATITFTLDTPSPVYFNRTTVLPSQRRNQCAYPQSRFIHFICISSRATVLRSHICMYIYIYVIRDTYFVPWTLFTRV